MAVVTVGTHGKFCEMIGNLTSDNIQVLLSLYNTLGMVSVYKLHVLAQYFSFTMTLEGATAMTATLQMRKQGLSKMSEVIRLRASCSGPGQQGETAPRLVP